ncbi:MAG: serine/threonine protein kinase [Myxococcales bacterium]|nr:serine/threonine protein kinase [Myxococcales bacterium]
MTAAARTREEVVAGRYVLVAPIASGGMARVHLGRMLGPAGFTKIVAIKRLRPHLAAEPEFVTMLLDEARLAARVRHANVVSTLDVVREDGTVSIVMEHVLGASLLELVKLAKGPPPRDVAAAVMVAVLEGLHAAHEARDDDGARLALVHRDVSPHNVIVGADGTVRVVDFGIAKAAARDASTRTGQVKGKLGYMSPEQVRGLAVDARTDVYAAAVVFWELLTGRRLVPPADPRVSMKRVVEDEAPPPSRFAVGLDASVDAVVLRGLAKSVEQRFASAREFADAIEAVLPPASPRAVARWVEELAGAVVRERASAVAAAADGPTETTTLARPAATGAEATDTASDASTITTKMAAPDAAPPEPATERRREVASAAATGDAGVAARASHHVYARTRHRTPLLLLGSTLALLAALAAFAWRRDLVVVTPAVATEAAPPGVPALSPTPESPPMLTTQTTPSNVALAGDAPTPTTATTAKRAPPKAPRSGAPPAGSCSPPWVIGADGIRVLRPGCR